MKHKSSCMTPETGGNKSKLFELQARGKKKVNIGKEEGKIRFIWKIEEFSEILRQAKAGVKETAHPRCKTLTTHVMSKLSKSEDRRIGKSID